MRYMKIRKTIAVVTAMGLIAASPMSALAATVEKITVNGKEGNGTYDAVSNTDGRTGISMSDGSTTLNGDVTVNGDVSVTNEQATSSSTRETVGVDISSAKGSAKLHINGNDNSNGNINVDASKSDKQPNAYGIKTDSKSEITVGGDITAKANGVAVGVETRNYGTTINIGGSVTAEGISNDSYSYGIKAPLPTTSASGENDDVIINVGGDVTASGIYSGSGVQVENNNGNVNINVSGDVEAIGDYDSTGVFIQKNSGSIDVNIVGDIKSTHDSIYIFEAGENALTKITAGGTISAECGAVALIYRDANSKDPEITAWKIESDSGTLVEVKTMDGQTNNYEKDETAEKRIKSNINYIIRADATENGVTSSNGTIVLKAVEGELGSVEVGGKTYKTANQGQEIIINVETAKGYKSTVQNNGTGTLTVNEDGSYTLTIPEGGGVDLRAVLEKIGLSAISG